MRGYHVDGASKQKRWLDGSSGIDHFTFVIDQIGCRRVSWSECELLIEKIGERIASSPCPF